MQWFAGMTLVAQTIRRLAHATGAYQTYLTEADAHGYLTPEQAEHPEDGEET